MIIAETICEVRKQVTEWKKNGLTVGLVPTMGYLHEGHASLVDCAVSMCDRVVVSDFVNPTQFAPGEDLEDYPRDFDHDCRLLEEHQCDLVFHPSVLEMYGENAATFVEILNDMPAKLCGKTRPIHFRGVCTVLTKLINIVYPNRMYMGKKDGQQLAVVQRMVRDLNFNIEVIGCPTVREDDGLAKSSRNKYLSDKDRKAARVLPQSLSMAQNAIAAGQRNSAAIIALIKTKIVSEPMAEIDYVEVVDGLTMQPKDQIEDGDLVAIAVRIGSTRLIDNFTVGDPPIDAAF